MYHTGSSQYLTPASRRIHRMTYRPHSAKVDVEGAICWNQQHLVYDGTDLWWQLQEGERVGDTIKIVSGRSH